MTKSKYPEQRSSVILPDEPFPLFHLERRKLKWASTPDKALKSLVWIFVAPIVALLLMWLVFFIRDFSELQRWDYSYYYTEWLQNYMWFIAVGTMTLLSGLLDFSAIVVTFDSIRSEHVLRRWDLLILATDKEHLARSKHNFARLRIARFLTFNIAVRVAVLLMLILLLFAGFALYDGTMSFEFWQELFSVIREYPLEFTVFTVFALLASAFYLIEPIWRVNAITAMGVALSARIKHIALLAPISFFVIVLMWILQGSILYIVTLGMAWVADNLMQFYWKNIAVPDPEFTDWIRYQDIYYDISNVMGYIGIFLALLIYLFIANRFYRILKGIAYGRIYAKIP